MSRLVPLLKRNLYNLSLADIELLSVRRGSFNGHGEQYGGFSLVSEKTELHGCIKQSDKIEFQSEVSCSYKIIDLLNGYSIQFVCHAVSLLLIAACLQFPH